MLVKVTEMSSAIHTSILKTFMNLNKDVSKTGCFNTRGVCTLILVQQSGIINLCIEPMDMPVCSMYGMIKSMTSSLSAVITKGAQIKSRSWKAILSNFSNIYAIGVENAIGTPVVLHKIINMGSRCTLSQIIIVFSS
jgi:hypothetical protein